MLNRREISPGKSEGNRQKVEKKTTTTQKLRFWQQKWALATRNVAVQGAGPPGPRVEDSGLARLAGEPDTRVFPILEGGRPAHAQHFTGLFDGQARKEP